MEWHADIAYNTIVKLCLCRGKLQEERQKEEGQAIDWSCVTCNVLCNVGSYWYATVGDSHSKVGQSLCCISIMTLEVFMIELNALLYWTIMMTIMR